MNSQRLLSTLHALSLCNATPGKGITRFSWSDADYQARKLIEGELQAIGLQPWTDGIGNIHARLDGKTGFPEILMGSHLDTVLNGGPYDGALGVVAALETLRSFHEQNFIPDFHIRFIAFAEEEGSNFGVTCLGSKAITGKVDKNTLKNLCNAEGSAWEKLYRSGFSPENLPQQQIRPEQTKAFFELHIEQNDILEQQDIPLGIVTDICGMRLYRITFHGHSDHAASPMQGRKDPMSGFCEFVYTAEMLWKKKILPEDFSFTVGQIHCEPNIGIVIPETVSFTVDCRQVNISILEDGWEKIKKLIHDIAQQKELSLEICPLSASGGTRTSPELNQILFQVAQEHGISPLFLKSGPAHDTAEIGRIVPSALLFVPSKKGLSHCPQEDTSDEHICLGTQIFEQAIRKISTQNAESKH